MSANAVQAGRIIDSLTAYDQVCALNLLQIFFEGVLPDTPENREALTEARAIMSGAVSAKTYASVAEMNADLDGEV